LISQIMKIKSPYDFSSFESCISSFERDIQTRCNI